MAQQVVRCIRCGGLKPEAQVRFDREKMDYICKDINKCGEQPRYRGKGNLTGFKGTPSWRMK